MKKLIFFLAAALLAAATVSAKEYTSTIGTSYQMRDGIVVPVPLSCTLSMSDTGAAITFQSHGLHSYVARSVEKVSEDVYIFQGFDAILPDGSRGKVLCAQMTDDGLLVVFKAIDSRQPQTYYFK